MKTTPQSMTSSNPLTGINEFTPQQTSESNIQHQPPTEKGTTENAKKKTMTKCKISRT